MAGKSIGTAADWVVGTADACRIARVDRVRLTEAIFRGVYNPPGTTQGHERKFDKYDVLKLYLWGRYLDFGIKQVTAEVNAEFDAQEARDAKQSGAPFNLRTRIANRFRNQMFSYVPVDLADVFSSTGKSSVGDEADNPVRRRA